MSKTLPFALLITLLPALVSGKSPSPGCALAYRLQQVELPQDIAVKTDRMTSDATKIAMDWWVARLSSPARPITWHTVEDNATCMIYIRLGWENVLNKSALGYTYMPASEKYNGLATVKLVSPWIVAHEIGHLIGCGHGVGVMRAEYAPYDKRLWIDDHALRLASLVRLRASAITFPPASQTIADATLPD
jgi:hypothetical protein